MHVMSVGDAAPAGMRHPVLTPGGAAAWIQCRSCSRAWRPRQRCLRQRRTASWARRFGGRDCMFKFAFLCRGW
jgi:hypothetical protein